MQLISLITNTWKNMIKKESSYLQYWDLNILYGWAMLQKLPVNNLFWVNRRYFPFNEDFIKKTVMRKVMKDTFLKLRFNIQKNLHDLHNDLPFLPERMKTEKSEKLEANLHLQTEYVMYIRDLKQFMQKIAKNY